MSDRAEAAAKRLGITTEQAAPIVARDVDACAALVRFMERAFGQAANGSCCKPKRTSEDDYPLACEHLLRLWAARAYHELAKAGAPADNAFPCECNGTGVYRGYGGTVNDRFVGTEGTCFRCSGKGWQTPADHKRNAYYDNHVRRIPA